MVQETSAEKKMAFAAQGFGRDYFVDAGWYGA